MLRDMSGREKLFKGDSPKVMYILFEMDYNFFSLAVDLFSYVFLILVGLYS